MLDLGKLKGVKANTAHSETDNFMTRTYVMPLLFDDESRRRLIAEHRNSPVGSPPKNGRPAVEHRSIQVSSILKNKDINEIPSRLSHVL